jgi:Dioxygenase
MHDELEDHDRGLSYDLPRLMSRRRALGMLGGSVALAALAACGSSPSSTGSSATTGGEDAAEIPEETAGPYPGDGSNGPNVLTESGVVRSDITRSFGDASGVAEGVPMTVDLTLLDVAACGTPLAGAAVYLWHCNIDGRYSMYDQGHRRRELPARRPAERQRRQARLHEHLPGGVRGSLAAHPLRGLREPRGRNVRSVEAEDLAARPAEGCL